MPQSIALLSKNLLSRRVRGNAANGNFGRDLLKVFTSPIEPGKLIRKIGKLTSLAPQQGKKGFLSWLWNTGTSFVGWIAKTAWNFISFSATTIWEWVVAGATALWSFDWNASDLALKQTVADQNVALAGIWGGVVGKGLGWLAGIAVGYGVAFLCPVVGGAALARLVATTTAKEMAEEVVPSIVGALAATAGMWAKSVLIDFYINYRWFIKSLPPGVLETIYGKEKARFILTTWGREGGPNMSFATQMEEAVEAIPDKALKAFVSNLLEESWDSFMEAGFIVASQIDDAYAQSKQGAVGAMGAKRSAELTLNAKADPIDQEKLRLINLPQTQMIEQVEQTLNTYRLIHNRDMGLVMGLPYEEYTKSKPQSLRLVVDLYSRKSPPYWRGTDDLVWATVTIPDLKRASVDWAKIKLAFGGANGYMWGRFKATVRLDTGRNLIVFAGTEKEAEERIQAMLTLTTAKLLSMSITEEKKVGERLKKPKLVKNTKKIYPGFMTIINRQEFLDPEQGKATTRGKNYRDVRTKIPLWTDKEPPNFKEEIARIFTKGA